MCIIKREGEINTMRDPVSNFMVHKSIVVTCLIVGSLVMGFACDDAKALPGNGSPTRSSVSVDSSRTVSVSKGLGDDVSHLHQDCGYISSNSWLRDIADSVARGEFTDPAQRTLPRLAPRLLQQAGQGCAPMVVRDDLFLFEDTAQLLLTNFTDGALFNLMTSAANALLTDRGDSYDFVGFWVDFTPNHTLGSAFYLGLENDATGIGQSIYNQRAGIGLAGDNVEGYVMMWNINDNIWAPGVAADANFTRLVLAQEFEHRFGMFIPNLLDGRNMQGTSGCGRGGHWNFKVDGQGSGMEIREWVGSSPATLSTASCVSFADNICFNSDTGGVFSYSDLYLMGYVSPAEMDAGNSELRYMDSSCSSPYNGTISTFSSSDIVASAGVRSPDSTTAQKDFHTGWIMIHLPGQLPSTGELDKAVGILNQWSTDWDSSTLGRGKMNNSLRGCTPQISLRPVSADTNNMVRGSDILVPPGGAEVTFDIIASDWNTLGVGTLVGEAKAQVDSTGYSSGTTGSLSPVIMPSPSTGAFIDTVRADYLFQSIASTENVDTATPDYTWTASASPATGVSDLDTAAYFGTLKLDVSPDATGTFTIDLLSGGSHLLDDGGATIASVALNAAKITIDAANAPCDAAQTVSCNSTVSIDNSGISLAPIPGYACGASGGPHDGTLWMKFVSLGDTVTLATCGSAAQDSSFAIYAMPCGVSLMSELGCSEDDCGPSNFLGDITVTGLTPGEEYLVQFSAWSSADRGSYDLVITCNGMTTLSAPAIPIAPHDITKDRYLSFDPTTNPGQMTALRVMRVGSVTPWYVGCGLSLDGEGFTELVSSPEFCEWDLSVIHARGCEIVPGNEYLIDATMDLLNFSTALSVLTTVPQFSAGRQFGDIVGVFDGTAWTAAEGLVTANDIVAVVHTFQLLATAPHLSRADNDGKIPNGIIASNDILRAVFGFAGSDFDFGVTNCLTGTCVPNCP